MADTLKVWKDRHGQLPPEENNRSSQRNWDSASIEVGKSILREKFTDPQNKARLNAATAPHGSDWLFALPITAFGLRLDDEAIRMAVGLRLGVPLCEPHQCHCGSAVGALGTHGLCCKKASGRMSRHQFINDIIYRASNKAGVPAIKEPTGLIRTDGKRPDGLTLYPWRDGRNLAWDVTVIDTFAASYITSSAVRAGGAAEIAARRKTDKYASLPKNYEFCPIAFETMGPANEAACDFISALGGRLCEKTGDRRETSFLFQRISVAIQRCNALAIQGTYIPTSEAAT